MQTVVDFSCIAHVEHAGQDHAATEVGEAEEVHQEEEQQQQYVGEDQEQALEQDLTDSFSQQGKHRCMIKPSTIYIWVLQLLLYLCIKFIGVDWHLVAWVGFVLSKFLDIPNELVLIGTTALLSAIVPVVI